MQFRVKAHDAAAGVLVYAVDAVDESDARKQVVAAGRRIISISKAWQKAAGRTSRVPLVSFSTELVALLDAGLPLVEAIETLTEKEANAGTRRALEQIRARLFEGRTLSSAFEEQPLSFPPLYVATLRASERTGAIREALVRYIAYQQQIDVLRKKLVSASIYPLVLCGAGLLVTLFLLAYVVPRFSSIYEDLGGGLPWASRMLMQWGQAIQNHGMAMLLGLGVFAAIVVQIFSTPAVRAALLRRVVAIPVIGRQTHMYALARLYRTVGMLLRGGTPAVTALDMSSGLLSAGLRPALAKATQAIREGQAIGNSMEQHQLTTPVAARMLRVGERSGNMGEMMERIASFYDEELARTVDLLSRLIEPILMTVVGIVIGAIVVLMYFPIFELAGSIK